MSTFQAISDYKTVSADQVSLSAAAVPEAAAQAPGYAQVVRVDDTARIR